jgi:Concanavalin A-like lectin/glucanases superfamily/Cadherin domain
MKIILTLLKIYFLITLLILISCKKEIKNFAPVIHDQIFSIDENSPAQAIVGRVLAFDKENCQTLTYSIINGNTFDAFSILTDGTITIKNEQAIDFEKTPIFKLRIQVADNENNKSAANITINLNDIEAPISGLILYMPFDGNTNDLSVNANNGIDSTADHFVSGVKSQALDFDGIKDFIRLTNSINSENGISVSFWLKTRGGIGDENNGAIVSKYSMSNNTRSFMIFSFGANNTRSVNSLNAYFYKYGYSSQINDFVKSYLELDELKVFPHPEFWTIINPKLLILNTWTHCIVNVTPNTIETWINGELCTKKAREFYSYSSNSEPVFIGNNLSGGSGNKNHFNGTLDELRIYDRGLTNEEIKTLFKE